MKSIFYLLILTAVIPLCAQKTVFVPDTAFREWLQEKYPEAMIGENNAYLKVKSKNIRKTESVVLKNRNIKDISGLECFKNLKLLAIQHNAITFLPELKVKKLDYFVCSNNRLKDLSILSTCKHLLLLKCDSNQLESLPDLSKNKNLDELNCNHNKLAKLPTFESLKKIRLLNCSDNLLTKLPDLDNNMILKYLYADNNKLEQLPDLSNLKNMETVSLKSNRLSSLPLFHKQSKLDYLNLSNNQFKAFPFIDSLTQINYINLSYNQLETIPIFQEPNQIKHLLVSHNNIKVIPDFFFPKGLIHLDISYNQISDISSLKPMRFGSLNISGNPIKYFTDVPYVSNHLLMDSMQLEQWPDLSTVPMKKFSCSYNDLKRLPLLPMESLRFLIVHHNQLTEIPNLQNAAELLTLDISYNKFKELHNIPMRQINLKCQGNLWKKKPIALTYELGNWEKYGNEKSECDCCE